jgi:FkbM family methyltransferase
LLDNLFGKENNYDCWFIDFRNKILSNCYFLLLFSIDFKMNPSTAQFIATKIRPIEAALLLKWFLRVQRTVHQLPNGLRLYIDPLSDFGLKLTNNEAYEELMTSKISSLLAKGDTFIDLGANEGFFSIIASKIVGNTGRVFAIEPQQRLWEVITKNASLNECGNVQILPYGIGATVGETIINLYSSLNTGASSFANEFNFKVSFPAFRKWLYGQQHIYIQTLDHLTDIFPQHIKLIKIDIEGFELEALKGAKNLLQAQRIQYLLVEIHHYTLQTMGQSEEELILWVKSFGYDVEQIAYNLLLFQARPTK